MRRVAAALLAVLAFATSVAAEIAPRSSESLAASAEIILDGTVESIGGVRRRSIFWDERAWVHRLRVEEISRGEGIAVGDLVEIEAWSSFYRLPIFVPAHGTGHRPLPLVGERCRIHATRNQAGRLEPILPNGWTLAATASPNDRARFSSKPLQDPSAATGWLILALGLGSTALSIRRSGTRKLALLALGCVLLLYGVWMTI